MTINRFEPRDFRGLPAPAQRYFLHALPQSCTLPQSVSLETFFRMRLRSSDERPSELQGTEELTGGSGFRWRARGRRGLLSFSVEDSYRAGCGQVSVKLWGVIPVVRAEGPDITRSARGRLAAESIWQPSCLLPAAGARWTTIDDHSARVEISIDGETIPMTLTIDEAGRLRELSMLRHGDVGVPSFQAIPYGFTVLAERSFDGFTLPSTVRGGWWFGTNRAAEPSHFEIRSATFSTPSTSPQETLAHGNP